MLRPDRKYHRRLMETAVAAMLIALWSGVCPSRGFAQSIVRGATRSPHGDLTIACENCHTATSWRPLRPTPDFMHLETRYPLRGLHQKVACRSCHANLDFRKAGTRCADCHADIHMRKMGTACENCHSPRGWKANVQATRDHQNRFPLLGAHAAVECESCHRGAAVGQFAGLSTECSSCHAKDYQSNKTLDHTAANFPMACAGCHDMNSWRNVTFDHRIRARFQLTGSHAALECNACHSGGRFSSLPQNCFGCHRSDYSSVKEPDHAAGNFPQDCTGCHQTTTWKGGKFDHTTGAFPLTGKHTTVGCVNCHSGGTYSGTSSACASCHTADYSNTKSPDHRAAGFSLDCNSCHTPTQWKGARFDHGTTRFQLSGAHASVACQTCHSSAYRGTSTACSSCHSADYGKTSNPDHTAAGFSQDCTLCHTTTQWKGARFDHNATKFPLSGGHATAACLQCHASGTYRGASTACASCHMADFNKTANPNHVAAGFSQDCSLCHTPAQWKGARFDHGSTRFSLTGGHSTVACQLCHASGVYRGTSAACASCHVDDFNKTRDPSHTSAGFSQECTLCHTTAQWEGAKFDHNSTRFPLKGAHAPVTCQLCHATSVYRGTPSACASCHMDDYNGTANPNHVTAGFGSECSLCHTPDQWKGASFNHTSARFPLTGAHVSVSCQLCHTDGKYAGTPAVCASCHLKDFNAAIAPNHTAAGFPQDCTLCHTTMQWKGAAFNHSTTRFPLTGAHAPVACQLCHSTGKYAGTLSTCVSCHQANFTGTTNPNHVTAGFNQDCTLCHTTVQWKGAVFNHSTTRFPLTGAHTPVACQLCHSNGTYAGTPSTCVSCHQANFTGTTNPNHVTAGFPQDCRFCHTTVQWKGAVFNHSTTRFLLTGAHTSVQCSLCHISDRFTGTPTACSGCHLGNYNKTTNPNHAAAAFPQDCSLCHATSGWLGAQYNHTPTRFPLTGAHTSLQCINCHASGQYATLATTCVSCHLSRYSATVNPNHVASGFPQDCTLCHTTTAWRPASYNHGTSRFPLTGAHTTVPCGSCHIAGVYTGTPTACYSCHQSRYTSVTDPNHVAAGFPTTCATCHTTTSWTGATFTHKFPISSGRHANNACSVCHTNSSNYAVFSCIGCHQHDKTTVDSHHRSVNNYVYNSTSCYSCHPNGRT